MKSFLGRMVDSREKQVEAHLVMLCVGVITFVVLSAYHVIVLRLAFDPSPYGQGLGCLLAGGGAASWGQGLQRKAESDAGGGDEPVQ